MTTDPSEFDEYIPQHDDFEAEPPQDDGALPIPCSFDGIDLARPPGFVGRVADWIDSQCRYPRRKLSVASAIVAMGNIGGLRHEDARDGITSNMMAFCVAASSSGKEAVMQAFTDLHVAAGIQGAMHGSMKSEQEIMRNVIDQQASYYNIDEIGIFLTKVRNAQKKGGNTAYLEGIFGAMMSIYSKANSRVLLGGDTKRELRAVFAKQLSKAQDDGDADAEDRALAKLKMVDSGLERPFMSVVGYTTPTTFDGVMDGETATQGLVGRAIIVNEKDINPRPRVGFKKAAMPMTMDMRIKNIFGGMDGFTVEWRGNREAVHTDADADVLLDEVLQWLLDYADEMGEHTGEASVAMVRRSYEMIAKVSFILSIPDGQRTVEHVRWAFAYVKTELDEKIRLVFANDNAKQKPKEALAARIMSMLDPEKGATLSILANRLRVDAGSIKPLLDEMTERGLIAQKTGKRLYRGQKVQQWFSLA